MDKNLSCSFVLAMAILSSCSALAFGKCVTTLSSPSSISRSTFLFLSLKTAGGAACNDYHFAPCKDLPLAKAEIGVKMESDGCRVTLSVDKPAFFVWVNARGVRGEFSDNAFTLLPERPKTPTFKTNDPKAPLERSSGSLSVRSLSDAD